MNIAQLQGQSEPSHKSTRSSKRDHNLARSKPKQIQTLTNPNQPSGNRDKHPGSQFFPSRLPGKKYDPGCSSRIRILFFYPSHIQRQKGTDPGSGTLGPSISVVITWFLVKAAALATVTSARATLAESVLCSRATRLWPIKKKILMNNHDLSIFSKRVLFKFKKTRQNETIFEHFK